MSSKFIAMASGVRGRKGWSPRLAAESDGERVVLKVVDWSGSTGVKPAVGLYVGAAGLVSDIEDGADVRGLDALATLIALGELEAGTTAEEFLLLLQNPATIAGQQVLAAITAAGLAVTGPGGTINVREDQAIAAVAAQQTTSVAAVGTAVGVAVAAQVPPAVAAQVAASASAPSGALYVATQASVTGVEEAAAAQIVLVGAAGDTQVNRVAATPGSGMYQTKAAGDAAGLSTNVHFIVPGAPGDGFLVYRVTGAGTSTLVNTYPDVDDPIFVAIDAGAEGDAITSTTTEDCGSVDYNRAGVLYVGKVLPHPAHVEDVFYIQTSAPDTNSGVITNNIRVFTCAGHGENDYGIRSSFRLLDQRTATPSSGRRENSFTWTEASLVQFRPSGDLYNPTLVEQMVGTGLQGILLLEDSSGGLSIDNGQTVHESFMGSGHGGVFAVEGFAIMADGVAINTALPARYQARHLSFFTKERYYRNRAGAITVANPVALVENEFEFLPGIMRLSSTVTFEQDLTGGMYGHATTVPTAAFTHLTRYADQRRRFGVNDYVGAGGANLEQVTRAGTNRVTYDDPTNGELDIVRTVCERYGPGTWPKPSGRLDFGVNEHGLKVTDDRKSYFLLAGTVAGAYHKFFSGEVVKVVTEYRISPPWSNAYDG